MTKATVSKKQIRIIITGINGFVGKHLARELHENNISVIGVGREDEAHEEISSILEAYHVVDLSQEWPAIANVDAVIHLAGLAAVGPSFDSPQLYININSAMVTYMAEYYLRQEQRPRLIVVSSGAIYDSKQPMPLKETGAIGYNSPYAVSKVLVENQCTYYRKRGLDCIIVRPFNHIGPGQLPGFLVPDVIEQLKNGTTVKVGNVSTKRDYTDVRDIARAYRLLATVPTLNHTIYNACSGRSVVGEEIVTTLLKVSGNEKMVVATDESKFRPTDDMDIFGDNSRLTEDTGWKPEKTLEKTLLDSWDNN
jgi:GDP-4-dehydro-6-deoxy-D-mannose reductase